MKIKIKMPEDTPTVDASAYINITDRGRSCAASASAARRTGQSPMEPDRPGDELVYDYRSGGRAFTSNRCLILADGFCASDASIEPGQQSKTKWLFCIGIWRLHPEVGDASTMFTTNPGEDVAPTPSERLRVL